MRIEEIKIYLKGGTYFTVENSRIVIVEFSFKNLYRLKRKVIKSLLQRKFYLLNINHNKSSQEILGEKIILRKKDNNLLVFSKERNQLYRKYTNENQIVKIKAGLATLDLLLQINMIKFVDNNLTKEKLVHGNTIRQANEEKQVEVFEKILLRYYESLRFKDIDILKPRITSDELFNRLEE